MEFAAPTVLATAIVTLLAGLVHTYMGINVGRMRGKHAIAAPLMVGHPELERAIRVHYNTLEALPVFFAALWISAIYFHPASMLMLAWATPVLGLLWVVGRILYMQGYMQAADKRSSGFLISSVAQLLLIVLGLVGIVTAWMVV